MYKGRDPYEEPFGSLSARRAGHHCFAILQKINRNESTFHFEAEANISVTTLLESVEDYARALHADLKGSSCPRPYRMSRLIIRPFENDLKESGFEGSLFTIAQSFKDTNFFHEALTKFVTFLTTFALVRFGLTSETVKAGGLSLAIAGLFLIIELIVGGLRGHGIITWKRR